MVPMENTFFLCDTHVPGPPIPRITPQKACLSAAFHSHPFGTAIGSRPMKVLRPGKDLYSLEKLVARTEEI